MSQELNEILISVKDRWGRETVQAIINEIDKYPIRYKGTLRRSISYSQDNTPDGDIRFNMADYGQFIDEGTGLFGPKKTPIPKTSIPGIAHYLKDWARDKGLNPWAVATNIVKRGGVKPRPFFNTVIERRIEILGNNITEAIENYLEVQINNIQDE
jgi:hypothetical protein